MEAHRLRVAGARFWLAGIQPEGADAVALVVAFDLVDDEGARFGVSRIVVSDRNAIERPGVGVDEDFLDRQGPLGAYQPALLNHDRILFSVWADRRPDRHHEFDPHGLQFLDHAGRIGPRPGIELPFALARPMEEVDDDAGQRQAAALVLAGY